MRDRLLCSGELTTCRRDFPSWHLTALAKAILSKQYRPAKSKPITKKTPSAPKPTGLKSKKAKDERRWAVDKTARASKSAPYTGKKGDHVTDENVLVGSEAKDSRLKSLAARAVKLASTSRIPKVAFLVDQFVKINAENIIRSLPAILLTELSEADRQTMSDTLVMWLERVRKRKWLTKNEISNHLSTMELHFVSGGKLEKMTKIQFDKTKALKAQIDDHNAYVRKNFSSPMWAGLATDKDDARREALKQEYIRHLGTCKASRRRKAQEDKLNKEKRRERGVLKVDDISAKTCSRPKSRELVPAAQAMIRFYPENMVSYVPGSRRVPVLETFEYRATVPEFKVPEAPEHIVAEEVICIDTESSDGEECTEPAPTEILVTSQQPPVVAKKMTHKEKTALRSALRMQAYIAAFGKNDQLNGTHGEATNSDDVPPTLVHPRIAMQSKLSANKVISHRPSGVPSSIAPTELLDTETNHKCELDGISDITLSMPTTYPVSGFARIMAWIQSVWTANPRNTRLSSSHGEITEGDDVRGRNRRRDRGRDVDAAPVLLDAAAVEAAVEVPAVAPERLEEYVSRQQELLSKRDDYMLVDEIPMACRAVVSEMSNDMVFGVSGSGNDEKFELLKRVSVVSDKGQYAVVRCNKYGIAISIFNRIFLTNYGSYDAIAVDPRYSSLEYGCLECIPAFRADYHEEIGHPDMAASEAAHEFTRDRRDILSREITLKANPVECYYYYDEIHKSELVSNSVTLPVSMRIFYAVSKVVTFSIRAAIAVGIIDLLVTYGIESFMPVSDLPLKLQGLDRVDLIANKSYWRWVMGNVIGTTITNALRPAMWMGKRIAEQDMAGNGTVVTFATTATAVSNVSRDKIVNSFLVTEASESTNKNVSTLALLISKKLTREIIIKPGSVAAKWAAIVSILRKVLGSRYQPTVFLVRCASICSLVYVGTHCLDRTAIYGFTRMCGLSLADATTDLRVFYRIDKKGHRTGFHSAQVLPAIVPNEPAVPPILVARRRRQQHARLYLDVIEDDLFERRLPRQRRLATAHVFVNNGNNPLGAISTTLSLARGRVVSVCKIYLTSFVNKCRAGIEHWWRYDFGDLTLVSKGLRDSENLGNCGSVDAVKVSTLVSCVNHGYSASIAYYAQYNRIKSVNPLCHGSGSSVMYMMRALAAVRHGVLSANF